MPTLHDLFDAATDGLPPIPDLAPSARQIARRRQRATRSVAGALGSALVIGAGTLTLSLVNSGTRVGALSTPASYGNQYVISTLQNLWPISGQHLSQEQGNPYVIIVSQNGKEVGRLFFEVVPDVSSFPEVLACGMNPSANGTPAGCLTGTTADGDQVLVESRDSSNPAAVGRRSAIMTFSRPDTSASPDTSTPPYAPLKGGADRAYRLHGSYLGQLNLIFENAADQPTAQQLLAVVQSPDYEQLIVSAANAGSFDYLGTPPAGVPGYSYGPSPTDTPSGGDSPSGITGSPSGY